MIGLVRGPSKYQVAGLFPQLPRFPLKDVMTRHTGTNTPTSRIIHPLCESTLSIQENWSNSSQIHPIDMASSRKVDSASPMKQFNVQFRPKNFNAQPEGQRSELHKTL